MPIKTYTYLYATFETQKALHKSFLIEYSFSSKTSKECIKINTLPKYILLYQFDTALHDIAEKAKILQ